MLHLNSSKCKDQMEVFIAWLGCPSIYKRHKRGREDTVRSVMVGHGLAFSSPDRIRIIEVGKDHGDPAVQLSAHHHRAH